MQRKKRTHVPNFTDPAKKSDPKTFVFWRGKHGVSSPAYSQSTSSTLALACAATDELHSGTYICCEESPSWRQAWMFFFCAAYPEVAGNRSAQGHAAQHRRASQGATLLQDLFNIRAAPSQDQIPSLCHPAHLGKTACLWGERVRFYVHVTSPNRTIRQGVL